MSVEVDTIVIPVVTDRGPDVQNNTEPSKSGKALVGIIYPPLEIRNIVDKTASFVARNGPEFEVRIKQHEANNPRFNFLTPTDPYHAYYQHKVKEFQEGKAQEPTAQKPTVPVLPQKVQDAIKAAEFVPKEPPPEFEFVAEPATINALDLDLIKLTALFVARNGRQFLTQLMTREARNYQFDFLKPQHSNFGYFTKLVEQYTKIMLPPKDLLDKLRKELQTPKSVLDAVKYRVEWQRYQRRIREREEAEVERERVAYAQIDWHDFVVVQTVDFQQHEASNLPPPCTPKDVGARLLAQQRLEATKSSAQTMEMEVESESEEESDHEPETTDQDRKTHDETSADRQKVQQFIDSEKSDQQQFPPLPPPPPIPAPPNPDDVIIRTDYNPRSKQLEKAKQGDQKWVISPLTGEKILADKLAEHMRFNTVDSQYFVQKEREMHDRQDDEPVYAPGVDISANILSFAERRSDIFGVGSRGAEQAMIGKKLGEDDRPGKLDPKSIWDGYAASVDSTTKAAQSQISIEQQIAQIHRSQGLLPDQEKERIGPKGGAAAAAPPPPPSSTTSVATAPAHTATRAPPPPTTTMMNRPPAPPQQTFTVRPTMTATIVPVVQMAQASVLIVQQPSIGVVGGFMPQRPPFPNFGAPPGPPSRMAPAAYPSGGAPPQPSAFFSGNGPVGPLPPGPPATHGLPGGPSAAPVRAGPGGGDDDGGPSAAKRPKTSEDQLTPEGAWLAAHGSKGPVAVLVQCPPMPDKPEWRLNGQTVSFTMDLREPILNLKMKIQDATSLPAGKQKLVYDGLFVKDSQSLAYYNMLNGSVVQLQLKERGGRKK